MHYDNSDVAGLQSDADSDAGEEEDSLLLEMARKYEHDDSTGAKLLNNYLATLVDKMLCQPLPEQKKPECQ